MFFFCFNTKENVTVFYTQLSQNQREQNNQTLTNFSLNQTHHFFQDQSTCSIQRKSLETDTTSSKSSNQASPTSKLNLSSKKIESAPPNSHHFDENLESIINSANKTLDPHNKTSALESQAVVISANNIFEDSVDVSMNSAKDTSSLDDACIVDDTQLSISTSSAAASSLSSRINYTDGKIDFDHNESDSNLKSNSNPDEDNPLDKNLDFIDETMSFNDSKENTSPHSKSKSSSEIEVIEENSDVYAKFDSYSRKRKSVDFILLDDDDESADHYLKQNGNNDKDSALRDDNFKKFKTKSTRIFSCLEDRVDKKIENNSSDDSELRKSDL